MIQRPYEPADLPRVVEVYTTSIRTLGVPFYPSEQISAWAPATPDLARWQQRLALLHTIVAESDGSLAGFASYTDDGYLDFLFTHPAMARRGVATGLYLHVESTLRAAHVRKIFTHASLAARPFFDHHGFQLDSEESVECRDVYLRRFAMHKQLCREPGLPVPN
jgi:putative acetyltransferase